jgi:orotate phosphoribosyltransferase
VGDYDDLRKFITELAVVHGRVVLASGREADWYVDLRRVTLHHAAAPLVGRVLLDLTSDWQFDAVGGLTLGADPVAAAMLHATAGTQRPLDAFVVRLSSIEAPAMRYKTAACRTGRPTPWPTSDYRRKTLPIRIC